MRLFLTFWTLGWWSIAAYDLGSGELRAALNALVVWLIVWAVCLLDGAGRAARARRRRLTGARR